MQPYPYTPGALADLLKALSEPRFQTYLGHANGNQEMGMRQYVWNAALASGLHGPVHMLEVTLRNAVHDRLKHIHGASWFDLPGFLRGPEAGMINDARNYLADRNESTAPDKIIAELNFRFWVAIFSRKYDRSGSPRCRRSSRRDRSDTNSTRSSTAFVRFGTASHTMSPSSTVT